MTEQRILEGGCLCGAIRYQLTGRPSAEGAGYCHCRRCQCSTGAPVVAWVTYPISALRILQGTPKTYHSTSKAIRQFCETCGTQLFFGFTEGPADIDISIASLDTPENMVPTYHIWTSSQLPWLTIADNLPRFSDDGNDFSPYK
jgi:hypothetical protein